MLARLTHPLQIRAVPSGAGEFSGYASTFDGPPDAYGDVVARGAFAESLAEHQQRGTMPALLWAHDQSQPVGVWVEMREDEFGLMGRAKLTLEAGKAREAHALMRDGALGLSIGFRPRVDEASKNGGRILKSVELVEVSLVALPANREARITEVKAAVLASPVAYQKALRECLGLTDREAKRAANGGWQALSRTTETPLDESAIQRIAARVSDLSQLLR